MEHIFNLLEIEDVARQVWQAYRHLKIWAFEGEMGAGKTTFIHGLCQVLEITSPVASPTYSIINEYTNSNGATIYHMDWYRLSDEEEALQAGVEDVLYSGSTCFIEWPGKAPALLPANTLYLWLSLLPNGTRKLVVTEPNKSTTT